MKLDEPTPRWQQISADLRDRIREGEFPKELPSQNDLAKFYDVSVALLERVFVVLEHDGLIVRQQGRRAQVSSDGGALKSAARELVAQVDHIEAIGRWSEWSREVGGLWITRAMEVLREVAQ